MAVAPPGLDSEKIVGLLLNLTASCFMAAHVVVQRFVFLYSETLNSKINGAVIWLSKDNIYAIWGVRNYLRQATVSLHRMV